MSPAVDAALAKVRAAEKRLKAVSRCPNCARQAQAQRELAKEAAFAAYVKQLPGVIP